jgi:hypothetical protein
MRYATLLGAVSLVAMLVSSAAFADKLGSAAINLTAVDPPTCAFTTTPPSAVTIQPTAGVTNLGDLGYTCNFTGNASLTLDLPNGTQLYNPSNGGDTVTYGMRWLIPPNGPSTVYQSWTTPQSLAFAEPTANSPNTETKGALEVNLPANLTVAGTYTSTISYTISP